MGRWEVMGRGLGWEGVREEGLKDGLSLGVFGRSIDDHDHLETGGGTKARFGGCMRQTEGWDMAKGAPLALTLVNYEQTNFASDGRGVTVPAFRKKKFNYFWHVDNFCLVLSTVGLTKLSEIITTKLSEIRKWPLSKLRP